MLILPQLTPLIPRDNIAVRLWDNVIFGNSTQLSTSNITPNNSVLAPAGLLSFWLRQPSGTFRITTQQSVGDDRGIVFQFAGNNGLFYVTDVAGNPLFQGFPNGLPSHSSNWRHYLISYIFQVGTCSMKISIDDVPTWSGTNPGNPYVLFQRTPFALNYQGGSPAELFDFFHIADGVYDAYDVDIRRKFIDASGNPVSLGDRGIRPFNIIPRLFYSGELYEWRRNKGVLSLPELTIGNAAYFGKASTKPT
jgi:hypothetical protein